MAINSDAKALKMQEKEQKLLAYFKRQKAKPKPKLYLIYMIFILALIYIVDEVATNLPNSLETELNIFYVGMPLVNSGAFTLDQLLAVGYNGIVEPAEIYQSLSKGLSTIGIIKLVANATLVLGMFYRPLSDRYGRKIFLFINTIGMAAALFIIFTANNIWVYALGFFALRFFVTPDQQVVYLYEIAPDKWRNTALSITKGVAEFGLVFVWLLRKLFLKEEVPSSFRWIFLSVAIAAAVVAFIALLCARESDVFLDSRIEHLSKTPEQRKEEAKAKDASKAQGGFIAALKYTFHNKQLLWIMIATAVMEIGYSCCNNYANVLNNGFLGQGALSQDQATEVTFWFPFTCALVTLIYGFISDKWGRKPTSIILLSSATIAFVLEFVGLYFRWPTFLIGLFLGIVLGADWSNGDLYAMMAGESCTTNLRASIMSVWSLFFGFGMITSMGIASALPAIFGKQNLALGYFAVAVPVWVIALIILTLKVKETKGSDLAVAGKENA